MAAERHIADTGTFDQTRPTERSCVPRAAATVRPTSQTKFTKHQEPSAQGSNVAEFTARLLAE